MARQINNLKELQGIIMEEALNQLSDENSQALEVLKQNIQDVTQELVYKRYSPKYYARRGEDGGLLDKDIIRLVDTERWTNQFSVVTLAQEVEGNFRGDKAKDLATTINKGWGSGTQIYEQPSKHLDYLNESLGKMSQSDFVNALKFDLFNAGYKVR